MTIGLQDLGIAITGDIADLQRNLAAGGASVDGFGRRAEESFRRTSRASLEAERGMSKAGLSAGQLQAATRGLPAQFTDIAVSLQAGQNPLTVFLQQGGQLKDMFGGVGPAARAMAGYVVGLINPLTVSAAAATALGVAIYQGADEFQDFNRELILTGGAAGVTAAGLMEMAAAIDAMSAGITQSGAAQALLEMVDAGVHGEAQLLRYAKVAAEFEQAGGSAASVVADGFKALAKDPLAASVKLTDQMGYLTEATYSQIKSLVEQGRTLEAVRVAQDAYASTVEQRTPALVQNIGYIEAAWRGVRGAVADAWDQLKNLGRAETPEGQLRRVQNMLDTKMPGASKYASVSGEVADLREVEKRLRTHIGYSRMEAESRASVVQREKERIEFLSAGDKFMSSEARKQQEIAKVQQMRLRGVISVREEAERIARIEESARKKGAGGRKGRDGDPFAAERSAAKEWADYMGKFSDLAMEAEGRTQGLSRAQQLLIEYLQSPAYQNASESMRQLALAKAYAAVNSERLAVAEATEAKFQEVLAADRKRQAEAIDKQNESARTMLEQIQFETALLGMNTLEREQATAMRELERAGVVKGTLAYEAYAAAIQKAITDREQTQKMKDFWEEVNTTAENVFVDLAMNGEDAFKRIGQSIKREIIQMLYEMTIKKWIIQVSGQSTVGGSSGNSWVDMAGKAYDWYTGGSTGATAAGVAKAYGTTAGTQQTAMLAAQESGMASSGAAASGSTSLAAYAGYAALIYAAVQYADKLYGQGYNREMLGYNGGRSQRYTFGYNNTTSGYTDNAGDKYTLHPYLREFGEAVGLSKKWADILSGTTRYAHMFGRKIGSYGYDVSINGGNVAVGGYESYKSGWAGRMLGRGSKEFAVDVDQRNAQALQQEVKAVQEGAKLMAQAMGMSGDAIDAYTGKLRVNFKGANTAAEQSERLSKAMDDLQFEMIKAAAGGKYSREEFTRLMESVRSDIEAAGISAQGMADILVAGMTGRLSQAEVGDQLASMIVGGIYNAIASQYANVIAQAFMQSIITPIFTAIAAGVPLSQAISQAAINNVVQTAQAASQALNAIVSNAQFQAAIAGIEEAIGGVSMAVTSVEFPEFASAIQEVNQAEQERYGLETQLLTLLGKTSDLRQRELSALDASNRALQEQIWAIEDAKSGMDAAMEALQRAVDKERERLEDELQRAQDAESMLSDVFGILNDNIRELRGEVESTNLLSAATGRSNILAMLAGTMAITSESVDEAVRAVREGIDATLYTSAVDRDRARLIAANQFAALQSMVQPQLSAAEQAVVSLETQIAQLDAQLQLAEDQKNALLGVDVSVKSVGEAIAGLSAAMATYSSAIAGAITTGFMTSAPGGGGGGWGGYEGGGESGGGWTASGYAANNPDLVAHYNANKNAGWWPAGLNSLDAYLAHHWAGDGQREGRAFANGGAFTNGIVQTPTMFNMGLMGEKDPEGILPLASVGGRLGVHAVTGGDAETKALLRELIARIVAVESNTRASAVSGASLDKRIRNVIRAEDGNERLMVGTPGLAPLPVEVVA